MPTYGYVAVDRFGKKKKGSIYADDQEHLKMLIKHDGYTLVEFKEQGIMTKNIDLPFLNKVKDRDLSVFCRQFYSMISSGVPISTSLQMLGTQTENKRLCTAISNAKTEIEKGETLSDAMKKQGTSIFPEIMLNMIKAGEASGSLEVALKRLANYFEKRNKSKSAVKRAMIYPILVVSVVIAAMFVMMVFVLPRFKTIFDSSGSELPLPTRILMSISGWLSSYWYVAVLIVVAIAVGLKAFGKTNYGKHLYAKIAIKFPVFGKLNIKTEASMFARTASTLLNAGLPLIETLDICSDNMSNIYFKESLQRAKTEVSVGTPLASGIEMGGYFPPLVWHMISIGEETGDIEDMLDRVAEYFDEEAESMTASLMSLLEPMIVIFMALCVGVIVISVLLPMFTLYNNYL